MYFSLLVSVLFLLSAYEKTMESTIIPPRIDIIACLLCVCVYIFFCGSLGRKTILSFQTPIILTDLNQIVYQISSAFSPLLSLPIIIIG